MRLATVQSQSGISLPGSRQTYRFLLLRAERKPDEVMPMGWDSYGDVDKSLPVYAVSKWNF